MIFFKNIFRTSMRLIPQKNSVISDLFIWRQNQNWKTNFELINLKNFFDKNNIENEKIKIEIRDKKGKTLSNYQFIVESVKKKTINFSEILKNLKIEDEFGTFSVYHESMDILNEFNSFITERGYTSYQYNDLDTFSLVHGNLDAISYLNNKKKLLGKQTLFYKDFNIQYVFENQNCYDLFFVNPTNKFLKVYLIIIKSDQEYIKEFKILPAGTELFSLEKKHNVSRIIVKSKYLMSRPLIFEYNENFVNSFHG
jgi:hypothetical protein